jgi:hypothetical protein
LQRGLGRIFLPQKAQKILDTGYYTLCFGWNADWCGFFTTKGTKVFEVLLIEIIDTIKRYFGGFLLWFVWD